MCGEDDCTHPSINDIVKNGITNALHEIDPTEMIVEYVAVVVSIDGDGRRNMWVCADDAQGIWTDMGLLKFGLAEKEAAVMLHKASHFRSSTDPEQ